MAYKIRNVYVVVYHHVSHIKLPMKYFLLYPMIRLNVITAPKS